MPDGAYHVAFAYGADGKDRFTTVWPNLNLLDGTRDFSGNWENASEWTTDGTYKDLTVKKRTKQWRGIYKTFKAPKDGVYTFSAYIKTSGAATSINRYSIVNGLEKTDFGIGSSSDWRVDTVTVSLKAGQTAFVRYEIASSNVDSILWNAGHKWEEGSIATPWMPSFSEVTPEDHPSYIGTYIDNNSNEQSTDPEKYTWKKIE